jgi:hypothetical protein
MGSYLCMLPMLFSGVHVIADGHPCAGVPAIDEVPTLVLASLLFLLPMLLLSKALPLLTSLLLLLCFLLFAYLLLVLLPSRWRHSCRNRPLFFCTFSVTGANLLS